MRFAIAFSLIAIPAFTDTPAFADMIEAPAAVDQVTLYNWGATVSRTVVFDAPAGIHEIIVPNLPFGTVAETLRVAGSDGLTIGAVSLSSDRLPAIVPQDAPGIVAAKAEIERLEAVLRDRDTAIATVRLRIDAANEQVGFLHNLAVGGDPLTADTLEQLRALSQMVGTEVLAARATALTAETEAQGLERDRVADQEALDLATQALAALQTEGASFAALTMTVETTGGPGQIVVTTQTDQASWYPVYDLRLTTGDTPALTIDRGVVIAQYSGEDWLGVDLTLSTARPSGQSSPSELYPWLRSVYDPATLPLAGEVGGFAPEVIESPVVVVEPPLDDARLRGALITRASFGMVGQTVVYTYGPAVDIRNGVDALRLELDTLEVAPTVRATAVPARDSVAYLVAELENTTTETILPGTAQMFLDGALTGSAQLPLVAVGDTTDLGFGALDGLILTRTVPNRVEGEAGIITSSNQINEEAVLKIENLTGKAWDLRVIDQVPYSEQSDLQISYSAEPPATITDLDDQRGVLAWDMQIGADETKLITLQSTLSWPTNFVLQ